MEKKGMIHINLISIEEVNSEILAMFRTAVSEERGKKADRYLLIDDSKRCICAELLLQHGLYHTFNRMIPLNISYNDYGNPFLKQIEGFSYNISHSGKWVVIAYGSNEVGIDVENVRKGKVDIADRFFTAKEKEYIYREPKEEQIRRFTEIWTLKESYIKYLGTGLSTSLDSFSVDPLDGSIVDYNREITSSLMLKSCLLDLEYYLAVCATKEEMTIHKISIEEMIEFVRQTNHDRKRYI